VGKFDEQLAKLLEPALHAGEEVVGMACVNYNGTVAPNVITIDVAVNELSDERRDEVLHDPDAFVRFPAAKQMALALTGGRLFVWSLGFSGKPKHYVGEVPLTAIVEVVFSARGYGQLELVMKSGARVDLEFARGEQGEQFSADLGALVEG
jgi:hypothetical protein